MAARGLPGGSGAARRLVVDPVVAEIAARRRREMAAKHAGEGARAVIAEIEGDARHLLALRQAGDGVEQPRLAAPGAEAHAGLAQEESGEGPAAGADLAAPVRER